ncbi:MAG: hypothetical protein LBT68_05035 [Spirochaetales bacterium]|jgi:predicted nucleic acid-binding protein|nr:hypothetical protein [Spirochaetales bacterium]
MQKIRFGDKDDIKLKIYLETSIFNLYFDRHPINAAKREEAVKLFEQIKAGDYIAYTSTIVTDELDRDAEPKRSDMLKLRDKYALVQLAVNGEVDRIAELYLAANIIPQKHFSDAYHIAMTTAHELDYILSFNFEHIVKNKTLDMVSKVNFQHNYKMIGIYPPGGKK